MKVKKPFVSFRLSSLCLLDYFYFVLYFYKKNAKRPQFLSSSKINTKTKIKLGGQAVFVKLSWFMF